MRALILTLSLLALTSCAPSLSALGKDNNSACISFTGFGGSGVAARAGLNNGLFNCSTSGGYQGLPVGGGSGAVPVIVVPDPVAPVILRQSAPELHESQEQGRRIK